MVLEELLQTICEAPILGIILAPLAVFVWAWQKDFPDKADDPKRVEGERVESVPPSEASSYIWDREIDGT
jgi:hypothetical protein